MSGGESHADESMPDCVLQQLPAECRGTYLIVGQGVRPNLRRDSDLFALDVVSTTERSVLPLLYRPTMR